MTSPMTGTIFRCNVLSFFCLLFTLIAAERNFLVEILNLECWHSLPNVIETYSCHLTKYNNWNYGFWQLYLRESVNELDVRVYAEGYAPRKQKVTVFDIRMDGCKFLETVHTQKIFKFLQLALKSYLNVFPKCPLKAKFNYTANNFTFIEDAFPTYAPEGKFRVNCDLYRKSKIAVNFSITGRIVHKRNIKSN